ncbi:MAG: peptidyl-prolyl cis-trans isomerase A (cyclophilin A) [Gammaproteobacteria bacterium]|nr:MAG: peptidyl-prolyl cis-trans isomerase A (cyclophilin A) [Gammaproteobacteria bacterium]TND07375.1 MAG: peptidyl-prolyl cis-trans isomerase A (cyclophilin A) [Gammaproteobacteria bacterium]
MKHPLITAFLIYLTLLASGNALAADAAHPRVSVQTSAGEIVVELDRVNAPITVDNFLKYVNDGYYGGTIFHRVIDDFMVQGGGYTEAFDLKPTKPSIRNEAANGLKNTRGTIAMARTGDPHSATAQFFINVVDNGFLDHTGPTANGWGYTVFGKVAQGMDVIDAIRKMPTGPGGPFPKDVPRTPVVIKSITLLD